MQRIVRKSALLAILCVGLLRLEAQELRGSAQVTLIARVPDSFAISWESAAGPTARPFGISHTGIRVVAHMIPGTSVSTACVLTTQGNPRSALLLRTENWVSNHSADSNEATSRCDGNFPLLPPESAQTVTLIGAQQNTSAGRRLDVIVSAI